MKILILLFLYLVPIASPGILYAQQPDFLSDDADYLWPTNASNYMSSTFGETRSNHFHSGMDIGTWGHEGYPVFASRDGKLYRAGVSAQGYGNVVYLKHDDGSFSLYAHLKDFAPEIREIVDAKRFEDYSFRFDEVLEHHGITFNQGDVIGLSGSTGVGPPHLHFELRSPNNVPFNPLLTNIQVQDNTPPRFSGLITEPLGPETLINGKRERYESDPEFRNGVYDFGTIEITGPAGLAVNVFDRSEGSNNVHAVYELSLSIDGQEYFRSRVDSFQFSQNRQMLIDRVYPTLRQTRRGFQRLFQKPGNTLPFHHTDTHRGIIDLNDGTYEAVITASDIYGNSRMARAELKVNRQEKTAASRRSAHSSKTVAASGTAGLNSWYWHQNWISPDNSKSLKARNNGSFRDGVARNQTGPEQKAFDLVDHSSVEIFTPNSNLRVHRINPSESATIRTNDQRATAHFSPGAVFYPLSASLAHGFEDDMPFVELMPEDKPLAGPVQISLLLDERLRNKDRLAFYRKNPHSGNLSRINTAHQGNRLEAMVDDFGTYYVSTDTIPPEVSEPEIYQRSDGKWYASVKISDDRSGIDYPNASFFINDKRGIAEYDPDQNKLRYHHPEFTPSDHNEFKLVVPDRSGNYTRKTFEVPRQP